MIKFIFEDDTTLADYSQEINDYHTGTPTLPFVATEDRIYIGSRIPFNHLYFLMNTANTASSNVTIAVWDGSQWRNAVETYDETKLSGASFGQSGYITFTPDRQYSWGREDTVDSTGNEQVTGLGDVTVYDHYWIRLSFSADLDAGTKISWVGHKFTDDDDLGAEFPDLTLSGTLDAWESGKTSWEEQHISASKIVIQDLKRKKLIMNPGQILDRSDLVPCTVMKVAEIAFRQMGNEFEDSKMDAIKQYQDRIDNIQLQVDKDQDGILDTDEQLITQGRLTRRGF